MGGSIVELIANLAEVNPSIIPFVRDTLKKGLAASKSESYRPSYKTDDDFEITLNKASTELPNEEFETKVLNSFESYYKSFYDQGNSLYQEGLRQSQLVYTITLTLLVLGGLFIGLGALLFFLD